MASFTGTNAPDVWLGTADDDVVTNIGVGLDVITTGLGNDTVTVVPDGGDLLDLLPDVILMGPGEDDHLIIDNRGSSDAIVIAPPLLDLSTDGLGLSLTLAGLERLTVSGVDRLTVYGGSADDTIAAGGADDTLDGGSGADTLSGGEGDDTYYVDNRGDVVVEAVEAGHDRVLSSISYTLGANVEHLGLRGAANINGTGNALDNTLIGNSGDNVLNGRGGADAMKGHEGDDTYYVDDTGDRVVELADEGNDTIYSSISFNLAGNQAENLILTGGLNTRALGNELNNILIGNQGDNLLFGGRGEDRMKGGLGDDSYYIDNARDSVFEAANAGVDIVFSNITHRLGANFENLSLRGSADVSAVGNDLDNNVYGNSGDNQISGGLGRDTLRGLGGSDYFDFNAIADSPMARADRIADLTGQDVIDLSGIDANAGLAGNQAFHLVDAFSGEAGELKLDYRASSDRTTLQADVDGDGRADFQIFIDGNHANFDNFAF